MGNEIHSVVNYNTRIVKRKIHNIAEVFKVYNGNCQIGSLTIESET